LIAASQVGYWTALASLPKLATLLFAFGGAESPGLSNTGGVLPGGQIVLDVSGELMMTPEPRIAGYLKWFLAHEAAHLFQNNSGLNGYSDQSDSWISEGGANAMVDVAFTRNDQSHYDCGQVLWWIADASVSQADIFGIWNEMASNVKAAEQTTFNRELFFETLETLGAGKGIIAEMKAVLDGPNTNPDQTFRKLIEDSQLRVMFEDDSLVSIEYPPNRG